MALGVLGGLGAMLALTGIFGLSAYSVSKRLRDPHARKHFELLTTAEITCTHQMQATTQCRQS